MKNICRILFLIFCVSALFSCAGIQKFSVPKNIHDFVITHQQPLIIGATKETSAGIQTTTDVVNGFCIGRGLVITAYRDIFGKLQEYAYDSYYVSFDSMTAKLAFVNDHDGTAMVKLSPKDSANHPPLDPDILFLTKEEMKNLKLYETIYFFGKADNIEPYMPHKGTIAARIKIENAVFYILSEAIPELYIGAPVFNMKGKIIGVIIGKTADVPKALMAPFSKEKIPKAYPFPW